MFLHEPLPFSILAYADSKIGQYEEAINQLKMDDRQDPQDLDTRLALTALMMKIGSHFR